MPSDIRWLTRTRTDGTEIPAYRFNPWRSLWERSSAFDERNHYWDLPLRWNEEAKQADETRFVLVDPGSDFFQPEDMYADRYSSERLAIRQKNMAIARRKMLWLAKRTNRLIWIFVTEYPENIPAVLTEATHMEPPHDSWWEIIQRVRRWNWWFGVRATNQAEANVRIPQVLNIPAVLHFALLEPLQSAIDLTRLVYPGVEMNALTGSWKMRLDPANEEGLDYRHEASGKSRALKWIVSGGDVSSAAEPVPSHPYWFRNLRRQCVEANVPFLHKNWGRYLPAAVMPEPVKIQVIDFDEPSTCGVISMDGTFRRFADGTLVDGMPSEFAKHDAFVNLVRPGETGHGPSELPRQFPDAEGMFK